MADQEARARRDGFVQGLAPDVQERVQKLEGLDVEISAAEAQFRRDRRELERKYEAIYAPLFAKRVAFVSETLEGKGGVPGFWLGAMKASAAVGSNISERDEEILHFLRNVTCTTLPEAEGTGFRLEFRFAQNEFLSNTLLSKTYFMGDRDADLDPVLERVLGTEVRWRSGSDPRVQAASDSEPCGSFFHFFDTLKIPCADEASADSEDFGRRVEDIEADYEMGVAFKEKIIPHAVRWYTGEAEDDDEYETDSDDGRPKGHAPGPTHFAQPQPLAVGAPPAQGVQAQSASRPPAHHR